MECRAPFDFRSRYVPNLRHRAESMNIRPGGDAIRRQRSRKEVFQPHLPVRLPCYDFTLLTKRTFDGALPCGLDYRLRVPPTRMV